MRDTPKKPPQFVPDNDPEAVAEAARRGFYGVCGEPVEQPDGQHYKQHKPCCLHKGHEGPHVAEGD